jgi:hypothetical protein
MLGERFAPDATLQRGVLLFGAQAARTDARPAACVPCSQVPQAVLSRASKSG